jgi:anti-sigma factor RsiW
MTCSEFTELAAGVADGVLAPEELGPAQTHLSGCERCRAAVACQRAVRSRLQRLSAPVPDSLRRTLERLTRRRLFSRRAAFGVAAGLAGAGLFGVMFARGRRIDLVDEAIHNHRLATSGETAAIPAGQLSDAFRAAGFPPGKGLANLGSGTAIERGGLVVSGGRTVSLTLYETAQGPLSCQMFPDAIVHLPDGPGVRRDTFDFRSARRDGLGAVLWGDGGMVCALVGSFADDELLRLAIREAIPA